MNKNILYPNAYFKNVLEITIDFLNENKIKGLILDVDNTLIDYNRNMLNGLEKWAEHMKQNNIKLYILSNSNKKDKVSYIANKLNIEYSYFAKKPFKAGFNRVKEILKLSSENIAVVGDQIFTDVIGANRCKMFAILVKPIDEKDIWVTKIKRPIEDKIIKISLPNKYKKANNERILDIAIDKMYEQIAKVEVERAMEKTRILLGFAPEDYEIRKMNEELGRCEENKITINPEIVKYDREVIDYIVLHEYCHLKYKSHCKSFIKMLEKYEPNYKKYERIVANI